MTQVNRSGTCSPDAPMSPGRPVGGSVVGLGVVDGVVTSGMITSGHSIKLLSPPTFPDSETARQQHLDDKLTTNVIFELLKYFTLRSHSLRDF